MTSDVITWASPVVYIQTTRPLLTQDCWPLYLPYVRPVSHLSPTCLPPVSHLCPYLCPTCLPPVSHLSPTCVSTCLTSEAEAHREWQAAGADSGILGQRVWRWNAVGGRRDQNCCSGESRGVGGEPDHGKTGGGRDRQSDRQVSY